MGGDPQGVAVSEREAATVEQVGNAFLSSTSPASAVHDQCLLQRRSPAHRVPAAGKKKAKDITGRQMSALHQELADTPYQANHVLAVVGSMYSWASGPVALVPEGTNPARGIERFTEEKRGSVLTADQLERLGAAIRTAETTGVPWQQEPDAEAKHRPRTSASPSSGRTLLRRFDC